jgi:predicted enzyme related to lactoylglutathione lyase
VPNQVVHFEIIGRDPAALRAFYRSLFGWEADTGSPVAPEVSDAGDYGFIDGGEAAGGIPAGIGGGKAFAPHTIVYVGVDDVETALQRAEQLGGTRVLGPARNPNGAVVVGHFTDPEGNLVGVAGAR